MKKLIAGAAVIAALAVASSANAADIARPVYKAAPAPVVYNWAGFYIGANAGYTWSNSNGINSTSAAGPCDPASGGGCTATPNYSTLFALGATGNVDGKLSGFIGGGQIGYNWQVQNWVWGIEADIQWISGGDKGGAFSVVVPSPAFPTAPVNTTFTGSRSLDYLGTVRGRVGFLSTPQALIYATGGLAYGQAKLNGAYTANCVTCVWRQQPNGAFSASDTRFGWTLGGGVEWLVASNWTFKAEYLYYDLGDLSVSGRIIGTNPLTGSLFASHFPNIESRFDGHIVRAGLNYKFN